MPPAAAVTLFETDVVAAPEVAGQELIGVNQREEGEEGWIGPFVANPAGTRATGIGIDVVMPRGLYYATDDDSLQARTVTWEVEARVLDDGGQPVGAGTWTALSADVNIAATDIAATAGDNAFDASATDFLDEGVKVGRRITVSGFSTEANNGTWTVASVTASRITVSEAGIVDEEAGASVTIGASGEYHVAATSTAIRLSFGYLRGRDVDCVGLLQGHEKPLLAIGDVATGHPCALLRLGKAQVLPDRPPTPGGPGRNLRKAAA